ncbi:uncharacterized protein LOC135377717 [Ornithodoros turicata]|uniref:uncharacterized protein LOC135377717 n=1 Tax=Ornithodoros turicata TaxID=34597 RepID=UPI003139712E
MEDASNSSRTYFDLAKTRLKKLVTRLSRNNDLLQGYDQVICSYICNGHAEEVPRKEDVGYPAVNSEGIYYMSDREVIKEQSATTKLRIVFDASSHARICKSLNDNLEKGPKLHPNLLDVLIRFRMKAIGMTAGTQQAYLQIGVSQEDHDALRFLGFYEPPDHRCATGKVLEWRMKRVPFGTTASAFLFSATLCHHLSTAQQRTADIMAQSFYVDDLVYGADSTVEAHRLYDEANMELMKW